MNDMDSNSVHLSAGEQRRIAALGLLLVGAGRLFVALCWFGGALAWRLNENRVSDDEALGIGGLVGWGLLTGLTGFWILLAGLKLSRAPRTGLARSAAFLALLPCSPCCVLDVPVGAWVVYALSKPEADGDESPPA